MNGLSFQEAVGGLRPLWPRKDLQANGLAPESLATVTALQAIHPVQPDPVAPPVHELPPCPEVRPCGAFPRPRPLARAPHRHWRGSSAPYRQMPGGLVRQGARTMLFPAQVGVAVPAGSELAAHCVRAPLCNLAALLCTRQLAFSKVILLARCCLPLRYSLCQPNFGRPAEGSAEELLIPPQPGRSQNTSPCPCSWTSLGPLDLAMFYLGDGVLAGDVAAVGAAVAHVQQRAASLGLHLNLSKCEVVVPGAAAAADLSPALLVAMLWDAAGSDKVSQNFEFLGAAVHNTAL